jgi:hypothetical protein
MAWAALTGPMPQDSQGFAVTVGAGSGQPIGVESQRGQHRKMGIDGVGFAFAPALLAIGMLTLDDQQASGRDRAG